MNNEVQFFTSILAIEPCLKHGYALSIHRLWDEDFLINVMELAKCETFSEDPCVIQQRTDFCWLRKQKDLEYEVERFWKRLVKENLIKDEFLTKKYLT